MSEPLPLPRPEPAQPAQAAVAVAAASGVHIDLDGSAAAAAARLALETVDCTRLGPSLRYVTSAAHLADLRSSLGASVPTFVLYGSGDFHHLSAFWQQRLRSEYHLISFDNHPDWDIRPPSWGCGGWLKRALDRPQLASAAVWGCANFELDWPTSLWRIRDRRLVVRPWAEVRSPSGRRPYACITRDNWREQFAAFARALSGRDAYVTIDMDCLARGEAWSNWEHGLFTVADLCWALAELRVRVNVVGGDICGFWSAQHYARFAQRCAAWWDHPRLDRPDVRVMRDANTRAACALWRALV